MREKTKVAAETMAALEATRVEKEKSADASPFDGVVGFFSRVVDAGREARELPTTRELAGRLRVFLEEIEGIERVPAPSKAPRMSTETLEAAEEVWGVLEAAKAELAELRGVEGMLKQTREALAASRRPRRRSRNASRRSKKNSRRRNRDTNRLVTPQPRRRRR